MTTSRQGRMALSALVLCVFILLQNPSKVLGATSPSPPGDATSTSGWGQEATTTISSGGLISDVTTSQPPPDDVTTIGGGNGVTDDVTDKTTLPTGKIEEESWSPTPIDELLSRKELLGLHSITTWFLGVVQPKIITHLRHLFDFSSDEKTGNNFKENWQEVVKYFIGFAVCAGLGVFLLIFVPLTGAIIGCCRCCNKCGGKVHPRDGQASDCGRCCCGFLLFSLFAIMLSGGILMVVLSTDINAQLNGQQTVFDDVSGSFRTLGDYSGTTLEELRATTLERYTRTSGRVFTQLEGVIPQVQKEINATYHLEQLRSLGESLTEMNTSAHAVQKSASNFTLQKEELSAKLNETRTNATALCTEQVCSNAKDAMNELVLDADFSNVDLKTFIVVVSEAVSQDISGVVSVAVKQYDKIFESANNTLKTETDKAKVKSVEVEDKINSFLKDIENIIQPSIFTNISDSILKFQTDLTKKSYNYMSIPFTALLALAVIVLLILTCYFIGLLFGFAGNRFDPKHPSCCTWKTGACWLVTGLVLTYLFYFILMAVLLVFFLGGGLTYTEVCRHAYDLPNSEARGFFDELVQANIPQGRNFTLSETYLDCANNKSLYVALKLEQNGINLTSIVNIDEINKAIDEVKGVNVNIGKIAFLSDEVKSALDRLGMEMESVAKNVKTWIEQTRNEVLIGNLTKVAELLDAAAINTSDPILSEKANEFRQYRDEVDYLNVLKDSLAGELAQLEKLTSQNVTAIVDGLVQVEIKLNDTGSQMVKEVIGNTTDQVKDDIGGSVVLIQAEVKEDVGRCHPVYSAVSGMINSGCVKALYPINAYWFCLGMVLIFMLPAILCTFKLITLYRKTKPYQAFEENEADLYMSAYQESPDYRAYVGKDQHSDMLLHRVDRPKAPDYVAMADNPVFIDDENRPACNIPRVVLRSGRQVLPVQPAAPDNRYFYAMPSRYDDRPPPRYTRSPMASSTGV